MKNYYHQLNLPEFASREDICNKLNSDKKKWVDKQNSGDQNDINIAKSKIKLIDEALEIFEDPSKFKEYNISIHKTPCNTASQGIDLKPIEEDCEEDFWAKKDVDPSAELYLINKYSQTGSGNVSSLNYEQTKFLFQKCTLRSPDLGSKWIEYAISKGNPHALTLKNKVNKENSQNEGSDFQKEANKNKNMHNEDTNMKSSQNREPKFNKTSDTPKENSVSKKKTMIAAAFLVALVIFAAINLIASNKKTVVDLVSMVEEPTFVGFDGYGMIEGYDKYSTKEYYVERVDISDYYVSGKEDEDRINEFISTVTYEVDRYSNLSNGDEITVTAKYDEDLADRLKIKVDKSKVSFTVSGLLKRYSNAEDIDKTSVHAILDYVQDDFAQNLSDSETLVGLKKLFFISEKEMTSGNYYDKFDDELIAIYEIKYSYSDTAPSETKYYGTKVSPFYPSIPFASSIDKLVNDYEVSVNLRYYSHESLDEVIENVKTDNLRNTIIELDVSKYVK